MSKCVNCSKDVVHGGYSHAGTGKDINTNVCCSKGCAQQMSNDNKESMLKEVIPEQMSLPFMNDSIPVNISNTGFLNS